MFFKSIWEPYFWIQIKKMSDIEILDENKKYVIKPDMLFWKRGKRGLLGLNLTKSECSDWLKKYFMKHENIDGIDWVLEVFLAEEFIKPETEYYISFAQTRSWDIIIFSAQGWVDIEDNWEKTHSVIIPISQDISETYLDTLLGKTSKWNRQLKELITHFWSFYRNYWFTSLEFNPIALDNDWYLKVLDAVAKVDDQQAYRQKTNWSELELPNNYGFSENPAEQYIRELDEQTGASLKFKILHPDARIWTLLSWGGGSLVITDTLWALWFADEIWNYGECSWNPSREFTREYTKTVLSEMLHAKPPPLHCVLSTPFEKERGTWKKYLIIAGAIANFTHIDTTFQWIIDAFEIFAEDMNKQQIQVLVRRWGINEIEWLKNLKDACVRLSIPAKITGSDSYMTDILKEIKL
jgi:ATP-citrate lyase beta-subunit